MEFTNLASQRLAAAVRERRRARKLTINALAAAAEAGPNTIRSIEGAGDRRPQRGTLLKLDRALGWPDGTAIGILEDTHEAPDPHAAVGTGLTIYMSDDREQRGRQLADFILNLPEQDQRRVYDLLAEIRQELRDEEDRNFEAMWQES